MSTFPKSNEYREFKEKIDKLEATNDLFIYFLSNNVLDKLLHIVKDRPDQEDFLTAYTNFKGKFISLESTIQHFFELTIIQSFSAFESYLKAFFISYFNSHPENVVGAIKIDMRIFLEQKDYKSMRELLMETFSEDLIHRDVTDLIESAKKVIEPEELKNIDFQLITRGQQIRNLFIHHNGIINARFIRKIGGNSKTLKNGDKYSLSVKELYSYLSEVDKFLFWIDIQSPQVKNEFMRQALENLIKRYEDKGLEDLIKSSAGNER